MSDASFESAYTYPSSSNASCGPQCPEVVRQVDLRWTLVRDFAGGHPTLQANVGGSDCGAANPQAWVGGSGGRLRTPQPCQAEVHGACPAIRTIVKERDAAQRSWDSYYKNSKQTAIDQIFYGPYNGVVELSKLERAFFSKNYEILMNMGEGERLQTIDAFVAELTAKVQFKSSEWAELAKTTDITPVMKARLNSAFEAMKSIILKLSPTQCV